MRFPKPKSQILSGKMMILVFSVSVLLAKNGLAQDSRLKLQSEREKSLKQSQSGSGNSSDSILHYSFPAIEIEGEYILKDRHNERKYHQLYDDIKRTYPLSLIVVSEIKLVNAELDSIYQTKSKQKAYLKWYEKHIYHTYIDTLKSLNIRQVKLFIKLTSRETGSSPYQLIKKYRGGWNAFLWQLSANALLVNLKVEYDPVEDAMIEDIIQKFY
jgi:hypothetical protein